MPRAAAALRRTVTTDWVEGMEDEARALLIRTAREGHAAIMARQGNPPFEVYANRPGNHNINSVVLPGPIVYTYSSVRDIVADALTDLQRSSPVVSGRYVRSHTIYVNGAAVETLPKDIKPSDDVMISNPVPYARRLEIGRTESGRSFVVQVDDRIYERVSRRLRSKYSGVARIRFTYRELPGAYVSRGRNMRSPAIIIRTLATI